MSIQLNISKATHFLRLAEKELKQGFSSSAEKNSCVQIAHYIQDALLLLPPYLQREGDLLQKEWRTLEESFESSSTENLREKSISIAARCRSLAHKLIIKSTPGNEASTPIGKLLSCKVALSYIASSRAILEHLGKSRAETLPITFTALATSLWRIAAGEYGPELQELLLSNDPAILAQEALLKLLLADLLIKEARDEAFEIPEIFQVLFAEDHRSKITETRTLIKEKNIAFCPYAAGILEKADLPAEAVKFQGMLLAGLKPVKLSRSQFEDLLRMSQWIFREGDDARIHLSDLLLQRGCIDEALEAFNFAQENGLEENKAEYLSQRAVEELLKFVRHGDLARAEGIASKIPSGNIKNEVKQLLAGLHQLQKIEPLAFAQLTQNIPDSLFQSFNLLTETIMQKFHEARKSGTLTAAKELAFSMPVTHIQDEMLANLCLDYLDALMPEEASDCAKAVDDEELQAELLEKIARKFLTENYLDQALLAILAIPLPSPKGNLIIELAGRIAASGKHVEAIPLLAHLPHKETWWTPFFRKALPHSLSEKQKDAMIAALPNIPGLLESFQAFTRKSS